ncbi:hypothetical protein ACW7EJ_20120, partial [Acinetobacter soli]
MFDERGVQESPEKDDRGRQVEPDQQDDKGTELIQSLVRSLNDAYRLIRNKAFWRGVLQDIAVTLALMFVLPFSLLVPVI